MLFYKGFIFSSNGSERLFSGNSGDSNIKVYKNMETPRTVFMGVKWQTRKLYLQVKD